MASPFRADDFDSTSGGDAVNVAVAAPVNNRVIIDLSQDDSDNDTMPMDIVEILDSPVLAERPIQHRFDVDRFTLLFDNAQVNPPPLSTLQNSATATTSTYTAPAAVLMNQPLSHSTTTTANSNAESNERQVGARRRNRQNDSGYRFSSASTFYRLPSSNSQPVRFESFDGHIPTFHHLRHHQVQQRSTPIRNDSHQQRSLDINNNNIFTNQSASARINVQSPAAAVTAQAPTVVTTSAEPFSPRAHVSRNEQQSRARRRTSRRRAYAGAAAVAHGGNQAIQQHRLFSTILRMSQGQLLNGADHLGARLLDLDNLSYEDMLSIFGNGDENCGASITDISLLPVFTVTQDDVITTVSAADGTCSQEGDELNSNQYCCSVCLENYRIGEHKKILPCFHNFHENCIDQWLIQNGSCPICKHRISGLS
jgi:hypothetical protein